MSSDSRRRGRLVVAILTCVGVVAGAVAIAAYIATVGPASGRGVNPVSLVDPVVTAAPSEPACAECACQLGDEPLNVLSGYSLTAAERTDYIKYTFFVTRDKDGVKVVDFGDDAMYPQMITEPTVVADKVRCQVVSFVSSFQMKCGDQKNRLAVQGGAKQNPSIRPFDPNPLKVPDNFGGTVYKYQFELRPELKLNEKVFVEIVCAYTH
ncbi:MAG TPA: hypothetical protein VFC00_16805 [Micromonosporaceae bacterium]|nr:hypothetical protein [Micromonosporaceae bacterium]